MEILQQLDDAFSSDPSIDEIGFMFDEGTSVLLTEHKLGIPIKCLKQLLKYCSRLLRERSLGGGLGADVDEIVRLSRALLIVRADNPVVLNLRKELLLSNLIHYEAELRFLDLVFVLHPKSPSCWEHRRWCLRGLFGTSFPAPALSRELQLCASLADSYPRNYYAWLHRVWLLTEHMTSDQVYAELEFSTRWLRVHVSDASAASYLELVLERLRPTAYFNERLLQRLREDSDVHIPSYSHHETSWLVRRYLTALLLPLLPTDASSPSPSSSSGLKVVASMSFSRLCGASDGGFVWRMDEFVDLLVESAQGVSVVAGGILDLVWAEVMLAESLLRVRSIGPRETHQQWICYFRNLALLLDNVVRRETLCADSKAMLLALQNHVLMLLSSCDEQRKGLWDWSRLQKLTR